MNYIAIKIYKKDGKFAGWWNTETSNFLRTEDNTIRLDRVIPDKYEARLYPYNLLGFQDLLDDYYEIQDWIDNNQDDIANWVRNATLEISGFYEEEIGIEELEELASED